MAIRTIRLEGDDLLRKKSRPVKEITPKIVTLLEDMAETMLSKDGLGLAAPQVGVLRRVVVVNFGEDGVCELINPEIVERAGSQQLSEGCLSIPGKAGKVERPEFVKVRAQDRFGDEFEIEGEGIIAVAFCHEIDHLDGVLYTDKAITIEDIPPREPDADYEEGL